MYSFAITFFERVNFKYIIMDKKRVYTFGNGQAEGKADMRNLLGGKGANLAEMNLIGVPVPPGFRKSVIGFRTFRCSCFHAWNDGYNP